MNRLKNYYNNQVKSDLISKLNYTNVMALPQLDKIVLSISTKKAIQSSKNVLPLLFALELITGHKALVIKANKSVASFKLRQGMPLGGKVTLRGDDMYYFLDKLVSIALPKDRDFRGFPTNSFDGKGNYSIGVKDISIFPEIESEYDKFPELYGMDITFVTTASTNLEAKILLSALQVPFKK